MLLRVPWALSIITYLMLLDLFRNITAADISKHTTLIIPGQHNLRETADKYHKQTKKTLSEFPKQLSDHLAPESVRLACDEVFQVSF